MKKGKAAGEDGVSIEFIKWMPKEWALEMREILNGFWKDARLAKRVGGGTNLSDSQEGRRK